MPAKQDGLLTCLVTHRGIAIVVQRLIFYEDQLFFLVEEPEDTIDSRAKVFGLVDFMSGTDLANVLESSIL